MLDFYVEISTVRHRTPTNEPVLFLYKLTNSRLLYWIPFRDISRVLIKVQSGGISKKKKPINFFWIISDIESSETISQSHDLSIQFLIQRTLKWNEVFIIPIFYIFFC